MADFPRKSRKSNFSPDEVDILVDSVRRHYRTLYGKFAKRVTNRDMRHKAWMDILRKVNGVSVEKRTLQEVKNKWKKCQYALKEKGVYGILDGDDSDDQDEEDSMPLQERLVRTPLPSAGQSQPGPSGSGATTSGGLKSQPLSPTKLKVTRQSAQRAQLQLQQQQQQQQQHHQQQLQQQQQQHHHQGATQRSVDPPANEEMCLRWNSHHSNMQTAFPSILVKEQYVDVTLAAEGKTLKCHRLILSSCSPYFEEVLSGISPMQHPVLFMRDIPFWILKSLCDFMYAGEVHIYQNKLEELLTVAEALKIKGLARKSTPPEKKPEDNNRHDKDERPSKEDRSLREEKRRPQQPSTQHHHRSAQQPPTLRRNAAFLSSTMFESSHDDEDVLDPLDLLEPLYEEVAEEKKPPTIVTAIKPKDHKYTIIKKIIPQKKLRKRKLSEAREPSPPQVFSFRKGTRSRPNVKIPKYYHSDFGNSSKNSTPTPSSANQNADPLLEVDEIKTEPIDVEDNVIDYSDDDPRYDEPILPAIVPEIQMAQHDEPRPKFKRIRLLKPIISEVHSVKETEASTSGGLEVIPINVAKTRVITLEFNHKDDDEEEEEEEMDAGLFEPEVAVTEPEPEVEISEVITVPSEPDKSAEEESDVTQTEVEDPPPLPPEETAPPRPETPDPPDEISTEKGEGLNSEEHEEEASGVEEVVVVVEEEDGETTASLDHLEKEAMSVANAIVLESQTNNSDNSTPITDD